MLESKSLSGNGNKTGRKGLTKPRMCGENLMEKKKEGEGNGEETRNTRAEERGWKRARRERCDFSKKNTGSAPGKVHSCIPAPLLRLAQVARPV